MTGELSQARNDSLTAMVESSSAHVQRALQQMLRKGGPEAEFLNSILSKPARHFRDSPENKALRPPQIK